MSASSIDNDYFDALYRDNDDPWAMRSRWYERRKRALLLACLPREHYGSIFEPGCATGETSLALAPRCDHLLSYDMNERAVDLTRARLEGIPYAHVRQGALPGSWPTESFDLIVLNELGYYLSAPDLAQVIQQSLASLNPGGQLVACHWRAPIDGVPLSAEQVHEQLDAQLGMHKVVCHVEADFLMEVWCEQGDSVAVVDGLR